MVKVNERMKKRGKEYGGLALTLFCITAAAALLLSIVQFLTAEPIAQRMEVKRQTAMETVVPGAVRFSQVAFDPKTVVDMQAGYQKETLLGYCVELDADGFGGAIRLLVGVSPSGSVLGVSILGHNETAGLGSQVDSADFLEQFSGQFGTIRVGYGGLDAVSGATVTSKAVAQGVSAALEAVAQYSTEGGGADEKGEVKGLD